MVTSALLVLAVSQFCGCSARQWYDGGRAGLQEECRRRPNEAQYQRCMDDARLGYDDYQRRREGSETPDTQRR
jgi:hypothetical protein